MKKCIDWLNIQGRTEKLEWRQVSCKCSAYMSKSLSKFKFEHFLENFGADYLILRFFFWKYWSIDWFLIPLSKVSTCLPSPSPVVSIAIPLALAYTFKSDLCRQRRISGSSLYSIFPEASSIWIGICENSRQLWPATSLLPHRRLGKGPTPLSLPPSLSLSLWPNYLGSALYGLV